MGALTSKPYAFTARPWELFEREALDIFDPFGNLIKLSFRGKEIIRVLPNFRYDLSNEWISDKTRFSYDSLTAASRLYNFQFFSPKRGLLQFKPTSNWFLAFLYLRANSFDIFDVLSLSALRTFKFFNSLLGASTYSGLFDNRFLPSSQLSKFFVALSSINNLFLIDLNVRYNFPLLAIRLRQHQTNKPAFSVFNFGPTINNLISEVNIFNNNTDFSLFKFKSRISRLTASPDSFFIVSFSYFNVYSNYLSAFTKNFSIFFSSALSYSFSEIGYPTCSSVNGPFNYCFSSFSFSHFNPLLPIPHPYEQNYIYPFNTKMFKQSPVVAVKSTQQVSFGFCLDYFTGYSVLNDFFLLMFSSQKFTQNLFCFSNYFTYFFSGTSAKNSINVLLNIKRQDELRSNYIYFL